MAIKAYTNEADRLIKWTLDAGDGGSAFRQSAAGIAGAVQVIGLSDSTLTFQASNDGANWATVLDSQGTSLALTADALHELSSSAVYVRPNLTGGTDTGVLILYSFQA